MSYLTDFKAQRNINGWRPTGDFFTPNDPLALPKMLQKQVNRFVGVAVPSAIGEDGIIGSGTVTAVKQVASFLIAHGAVNTSSFVQSGASADAPYIAKHVSDYISIFDKAATARGLLAPKPPKKKPPAQPDLPVSVGPVDPNTGLPAGGGLTDGLMAASVGGVPLVFIAAAGAIYYFTQVRGKKGKRSKR